MHDPNKPPKQKSLEKSEIEQRFSKVVRPVDLLKEKGLKPMEPHQPHFEGEMSPEVSFISKTEMLNGDSEAHVLLTGAHAGELAFETMMDRLTDDGLRNSGKVDYGTQEILTSDIVPSVATRIARLGGGFDMNRRSPFGSKETASFGSFIWSKTLLGNDMFKEDAEPTQEELKEMARYHEAYFGEIKRVIKKMVEKKADPSERILAIDVHSYPDPNDENRDVEHMYDVVLKQAMGEDVVNAIRENSPLFVISDRGGMSCDQDIKEALGKALTERFDNLSEEERGLILDRLPTKEVVAMEKYLLAGGYNTEFWGNQKKDDPTINGLQIEVNDGAFTHYRDGYDDASYDDKRLALIKRVFQQAVQDVNDYLKN